MAQDSKHFQLLKSLHKFSGRDTEYPEWKYTTRRTLALYRPTINKLLGENWSPTPIYELHDQDDDGDQDGGDQEHEDDEDTGDRDDQDAAYQEALQQLRSAESASVEARHKAALARKVLTDADEEQKTITRAMKDASDTAELLADQAETIVRLHKEQLTRKRSSQGQQESRRRPSAPRSSSIGRSRSIVNQHELDEFEEADSQLFNILYHILIGPAKYVLRRHAPVDESSGSGLAVWKELESKFQPADEHRRRNLERELESATMRTGTDPDIFITHVWHLAEQLRFIGGTVTDEKLGDIILQGLPAEYHLIRYHASSRNEYNDLADITQTARNMWYNRNRKDGAITSFKDRRGSARDAGGIQP